ncbi:MAG: ATP-binding protein [Luminiphilus sp.]|nr:ATP-binding protein [Luminiphilus sp.]MDG1460210.1 ATP-binding protein [Luminiphilus sp.]
MKEDFDRELGSADEIARNRYLDILHQFTLRQSSLTKLEDIVWNIAKTAIAELGFEDCVVYLLADEGLMLKQVAAHGPKNPVDREIFNEITIPVGQGIVGYVAQTGEVQRIDDARLDPRYIEDDNFRLSELAVPISHDGRIIGVLDSEHHAAKFFTDEDVRLFTTIASLASTRIDTALAMDRLEKTVEHLEEARQALEIQTEELREARLAAEAASVAKTNFLANMSHEIRTPMTAIVGFADLLANGVKDPEQQEQWRSQLTENARYLKDLIGNVLDMSAVEAGEMSLRFESINLLSTVTAAVENLRVRAERKNVGLETVLSGALPDAIITDSLKFREIIVNLLSNAIKYTERGAITVTLSAKNLGAKAILSVEVLDTGIGIDSVQMDNLFLPFSRVHDTHHRAGIEGTGLGLALSRQIAGALEGDIAVASTLGKGSKFTLTLPVEISAHTHWSEHHQANPFAVGPSKLSTKPSVPGTKELLGLRVLVCEDSASVATLLEVVLNAAGAIITQCVNGLEGLRCFEEQNALGTPPDLVLMDMQMPIMDGYEATGHIKAVRPDIPVVALTAFALADDIDRCLAAGCDYYLTKPIQIGTFTEELRLIRERLDA